MKGNTRKNNRYVDAKRTRLGRFLCRLMGDEAGQGLMEYVVLGVLVIAAVVGVVVFFGDGLQNRFEVMYHSIFGHTETVKATTDEGEKDKTKNVTESQTYHNKTKGNKQ